MVFCNKCIFNYCTIFKTKMCETSPLEETADLSLPAAVSLAGYFITFTRENALLLLICSGFLLFDIYFFLNMKRWKKPISCPKSQSRKGSLQNRIILRKPVGWASRRQLPSRPEFHTPVEPEVSPSCHSEVNDETLNEVTWAFDSSEVVSLYHSHNLPDNTTKQTIGEHASSAPGKCGSSKPRIRKTKKKASAKTTRVEAGSCKMPQERKEKSRWKHHQIKERMIKPTSPPRSRILNNVKPKPPTRKSPPKAIKLPRPQVNMKTKKSAYTATRIPVPVNKRVHHLQKTRKVSPKHNTVHSDSRGVDTTGDSKSLNNTQNNIQTTVALESDLAYTNDNWTWFPTENRPCLDSSSTRRSRFQSNDPRLRRLAEEIELQDRMNRDIERNARSIIESSSISSDQKNTLPLHELDLIADKILDSTYYEHLSGMPVKQTYEEPDGNRDPSSQALFRVNDTTLFRDCKRQGSTGSGQFKPESTANIPENISRYGATNYEHTKTLQTTRCDLVRAPPQEKSYTRGRQIIDNISNLPSYPYSNGMKNVNERIGKKSGDFVYSNMTIPGDDVSCGGTENTAVKHGSFWPRSMSAMLPGQMFKGIQNLCNQSEPAKRCSLNLALNTSPSPARERGVGCRQLLQDASGNRGLNSLLMLSKESDTETYGFSKRNESQVESVIKREVEGIVSRMFNTTPNMNAFVITPPSHATPGRHRQHPVSPLYQNCTENNRKAFEFDEFAPTAEQGGHGQSHCSRDLSRVSMSACRSSSASKLTSGASKFGSVENNKVNIYSPHYYLGKKRSSSCPRKCYNVMSSRSCQLSTNEPSSTALGGHGSRYWGQGSGTLLTGPFGNSKTTNKDIIIQHVGKPQTSQGKNLTSYIQNGYNEVFPHIYNDASSLEIIPGNIQKGNPVESNNSSKYLPSSLFIGRRKPRDLAHSRGLPYERTLHRCKVDRLNVPLKSSENVYSCPNLEELAPCRTACRGPLGGSKYVKHNLYTPYNSLTYSDSRWENDSLKTNCSEGFTVDFGNIPMFDSKERYHHVADFFTTPNSSSEAYDGYKNDIVFPIQNYLRTERNAANTELSSENVVKPIFNTLIQNVSKKDNRTPTHNADSGYETISTDLTVSRQENILPLIHEDILPLSQMKLVTEEAESKESSPAPSDDVCPSSPEVAQVNHLTSDDDSTQDTLPPSFCDSLWSWDRSHTDMVADFESTNCWPKSIVPDDPDRISPHFEQSARENGEAGECVTQNTTDVDIVDSTRLSSTVTNND